MVVLKMTRLAFAVTRISRGKPRVDLQYTLTNERCKGNKMLGSGSLPNTSRKAVRHGHQGNVKKSQVLSRVKCAEEREEMKEFGITDADEWTPAHEGKLTTKKAIELILILERIGHETKTINLNLIK